ncbi:carboxylating nicotinate-nucleotide diphosphorylase [Demequina sp. TTPB684]|uniref:carboxylating nicotinate-nucleotide diphosphorylase n=1 Tax=unclassified Demequina TaxID=2620311 RepID=UPI001CF5CF86|nr:MULTISPECIES: carboxylating nicotinate-nucleotide diphosphorylase [unclassified Demequina]MCB2413335.1 carboxylating nicotinate-nucleotide diphosphorylase [Demequina sp. TTPB684]UPU87473.1 carboxylating nicotinate-nucleotide diphosphorylase [Demequina sp. TMPB413]
MMPEDLPQDRELDPAWLKATVAAALDEDLGGRPGRDVTTQATIAPTLQVTGDVVVRDDGVLAGIGVVEDAMTQVAQRLGLDVPRVQHLAADGDAIAAGTSVARVEGAGHVVLIAERTVLNLMSRASGVATHTRRWADALAGTEARVLDTRKTTPLLRELDKYAVRCGGGVNKRFGLYDCAMIKDNHIIASGSIADAVAAIRQAFPDVPLQVEVEGRDQALEALAAGIRFLMLDNMPPAQMAELIAEIRGMDDQYGAVRFEATGGLTLANAADVAATGVDFMSVGALTHSSAILDIALDVREAKAGSALT